MGLVGAAHPARASCGLPMGIARGQAFAAPSCNLVWTETGTPNVAEARAFADDVHAAHPEKMLSDNLSPAFNWDVAGMSDEHVRRRDPVLCLGPG